MKLAITIDGAVHEVSVRPSDLVSFERTYNLDWNEARQSPKMEYTFFLAWHAAKREALTDLDFEAFLDAIDDLDPVEEAPLARPKRRR